MYVKTERINHFSPSRWAQIKDRTECWNGCGADRALPADVHVGRMTPCGRAESLYTRYDVQTFYETTLYNTKCI